MAPSIPASAQVKEEVQGNEQPVKELSISDSKPPIISKSSTTAAARATMSPIARFAKIKPENPPPEYEFSLGQPSGLSALDMDVIKLTAQFTAANGREFLAGLAQREMRNPQFDFLKPTHLLFSYFTSLVDAYAKVLAPSDDQAERLKLLSDKMKALELSVQRWVYTKDEAERKYAESSTANADKIAFNSIDWHDFVVVETVDFPVDEVFEYPAAQLLSGSATSAVSRTHISSSHIAGHGYDEDADMDTSSDVPAPPRYEPSTNVDMEDDSDMKVVTDYRPRVAPGATKGALTMADPLSGRMLPASAMEEHMRVALLDPKWRVEQQRFQDKQRETGYAEGGSIADSLKQFAKRRGDIFGAKKVGTQPLVEGESQNEDADGEDDEDSKPERPSTIPLMSHQMANATAYLMSPPPHLLSSIGPVLPASQAPIYQMPMSSGPMSYLPPSFPPHAPAPMYAPGPPTYLSPPAAMPFLPPPPPPSFSVPTTTSSVPPPVFAQTIPSISSQDAPKKPRIQETVEVLSAEKFIASFPDDYSIQIAVPNDTSSFGVNWGFQGQTFNITVKATMDVRVLKDLVSRQIQTTGKGIECVPANRFQLKMVTSGIFLKDSNLLAVHNVGPNVLLEVNLKSRR